MEWPAQEDALFHRVLDVNAGDVAADSPGADHGSRQRKLTPDSLTCLVPIKSVELALAQTKPNQMDLKWGLCSRIMP